MSSFKDEILNRELYNQSSQKFPTEIFEIPSKGLLYPEEDPLSSGRVELKYMTAREEDILMNKTYIESGIVLDKLLQSLIVSNGFGLPINYDNLLTCDRDAIMVAVRIMGYGPKYNVVIGGQKGVADLNTMSNKEFDESLLTSKYLNEFSFELSKSKTQVTFKLLDVKTDKLIESIIKKMKNAKGSGEVTTRLKYIITSVNGSRDQKDISAFIDSQEFYAQDSQSLREYINKVSPGLNYNVETTFEDDLVLSVRLPMTAEFFWPGS